MMFMNQCFWVVLMLCISHQVCSKNILSQTKIDHPAELKPNVKCVTVLPDQVKPIYQINDDLMLYTHARRGGVYLFDNKLNPQRQIDKAIPIIQGWWLHSINKVVQQNDHNFVLIAKFITGVGPVGWQPFLARVRFHKVDESWVVLEPTHGEGH